MKFLTQQRVIAVIIIPLLLVCYYGAYIVRMAHDFIIEGWKDGKAL